MPNALSTGTTYAVTVTTPSGTSAPRAFKVVAGVSFSPSTIEWSATSSLPVAQQGFSTIGTSGFIYAFGGNTATTTTGNEPQTARRLDRSARRSILVDEAVLAFDPAVE